MELGKGLYPEGVGPRLGRGLGLRLSLRLSLRLRPHLRPHLHMSLALSLSLGLSLGIGLSLGPSLCLCPCLHMRCRHLRRYPGPHPRMRPCPRLRFPLPRQVFLAARRSPGPSARLAGEATLGWARRARRAGRKMLRFCAVLAWMNKRGGVYAHPISIRNDLKKGGTRRRLGPPSSGAHQKAPSGA